MGIDTNNPHAMDADRFHAALVDLLGRVPDDEVTVLANDLPGLSGTCRQCGYDDLRPPLRFVTHTPNARALVAIIRVRAAMAAGWDGRSGCWGSNLEARRIHAALIRQGAPSTPPARLYLPKGVG